MRASTLIEWASFCWAFFAVGHTVGMLSGPMDEADQRALDALGRYSFDVMGSTHTHLEFYRGEGWYLTLFAVFFVVVCWLTVPLARHEPDRARAFVALLAVTSAVSAAFNVQWFFLAPQVTAGLSTVLLSVAFIRLHAAER